MRFYKDMGKESQVGPMFATTEDRHVQSLGIIWVLRVMNRRVVAREEFWTFMEWLIPDDMASLAGVAHEGLADEKEQGTVRLRRGFKAAIEGWENRPKAFEALFKSGRVATRQAVLQGLRSRLLEEGRLSESEGNGSILARGRDNVVRVLGLSELESDIFQALFVVNNWRPLDKFFNDFLECDTRAGHNTLACMLGVTMGDVRKALGGKLQHLEIVDSSGLDYSLNNDFEQFFISGDTSRITRDFFTIMQGKPLEWDTYLLDGEEKDLAESLLAGPSSEPTHVLLYGPPGTGKTSFAHTLAHRLGLDAVRITFDKWNDNTVRRVAIQTVLHMTDNGAKALVMVDEADKLLNTHNAYIFSGDGSDKGWLNEFMERPGVRLVWITNHIDEIEDSVLRRFAYSLRFEPLRLDQRVALWDRILRRHKVKSLLSAEDIRRYAHEFPLSAGSIDMGIKNARRVAGRNAPKFRKALSMSLSSSKVLLDGGRKPRRERKDFSDYSLEALNLDRDVHQVIKQLVLFDQYLKIDASDRHVNMNLLLHGPSGTGKTELSRYLGHRLGREVLVERTSDLLDMYVGQTERNISRAFREAEEKGAILVVDEADSLLFSRDMADRSWETSMVNEFLTQMESFRGLLICTTNRLQHLDAASLRRFNHKIAFDYLGATGNRLLYKKMLQPLVDEKLAAHQLQQVESLKNLTPGDFKVVRDRYAFYPQCEVEHGSLIAALEREAMVKRIGGTKVIGF